jgi:hypothetical protein
MGCDCGGTRQDILKPKWSNQPKSLQQRPLPQPKTLIKESKIIQSKKIFM